MERINCRTGMTQIGGVLSHAGGGRLQALVFVGDAVEDLPAFTPATLASRYFCFRKGTRSRV
jgi:hypothetical protein